MSNKFDPKNKIIRLCMMGMSMKEQGNLEEANLLFLQAYNEAVDDFEKFIAVYHIGKYKKDTLDRLKWMKISLQYAVKSKKNTSKRICI